MNFNIDDFTKQRLANKSGIYAIVNICNDKRYVGSAKNLLKRFGEHFRRLGNNKHENKKLQNSYNKHGASSFVFHVLEHVDNIDFLIEKEQMYLNYYFGSKFCYNICGIAGSTRGIKHKNRQPISEETRRKKSEAMKGERNHRFGIKNTEQITKLIKINSKPVKCIYDNLEFESARAADKYYGFKLGTCSNHLCHKTNSVFGKKFEYIKK